MFHVILSAAKDLVELDNNALTNMILQNPGAVPSLEAAGFNPQTVRL